MKTDTMDILQMLKRQQASHVEFQQNKLLNKAYAIINGEVKEQEEPNDIHFKETALKTKTLDYRKVFNLQDIKQVCIANRLRFLDLRHYTSSLPYDIHIKCAAFEMEADRPVNFKILTEGTNFKASYPNTQHLIFAELDNGDYYFIRQWGNSYSRYRKLMVTPYKSVELLFLYILALSLILTLITPTSFLTTRPHVNYFSMIRIAYFSWCLIFLSAMFTYYVVGIRKGLNSHEWNSDSFL